MTIKVIRQLRFLLIIFLGLLSGCWFTLHDAPGNGSKPAELLRSGVHGTRTLQPPAVTWITDRTALKQVYTALNRHSIGNNVELPDINFDLYGVLLIEMGQKSTGGYAIKFDPSHARVLENQTIIHVSWNTPPDGAMLTQAITSPFILLKIQRTGIASIAVLDQREQLLFEISINLGHLQKS